MLRVIKEVKPKWVIGENVRGLVSWNEGMVFHEVYDDLEREGYEVQSVLIPAAGVNAPHVRYRIFFIAHSNSVRLEHSENGRDIHKGKGQAQSEGSESSESIKANGEVRNATNALHEGLQGGQDTHKWEEHNTIWRADGTDLRAISEDNEWDTRINFSEFPTQPPVLRGDDGIPRELDSITFSKWRKQSIMAYGNAIVPQIAIEIFKTINVFESNERLNREKAI